MSRSLECATNVEGGPHGEPGSPDIEKEMETLYMVGPATHGDPKPCVSARKGYGEALAGVHPGQRLSREITTLVHDGCRVGPGGLRRARLRS